MALATLVKYLRMPLHTAPLLVILIFAFLTALVGGTGSITGIPMLLILTSWFFKYSFVLLDHTVDGRHDPPALSAEMVNPVEQRPIGMLILMGGCYWATRWLESYWGEWPVWILRVVLLLVIPAIVAAMSITGRFFAALNPITVLGTVARIPVGYFQTLAVIAALWLLPALVLKTLGWTPPLFLSLALFMYLWLAMCTCIGGLVYEHRHELDYEPSHSPERTQAREEAELEKERSRMADTIFAEVRGNAFANAGASVRKLIEEAQAPLDEFRWLYARAAQWPDQRLAEYLVQLCLPRLLEARANGEALDAVRARLKSNQSFRPASGAQLIRVAILARDAGDRMTARALLEDFAVRFPNDPALAMAGKLAADLEK